MKWLKNKDIRHYTIRQAQSCDYLEEIYPNIDKKGDKLLNKLLNCHKRQKKDIENIIGEIPIRNVGSYYFDKMKSNHKSKLSLLSIQYISYLRGSKRYYLLKKQHQYNELWHKFYKDANNNADMVLNYLLHKYKFKAIPVLLYFKFKELFIIFKINKHNEKRNKKRNIISNF